MSTQNLNKKLPMPDGADFKITCGKFLLMVHKKVLAKHSEYFEEVFSAPGQKDTDPAMLQLSARGRDDEDRYDLYEPKPVEEVIYFFYTNNFTDRVKEMEGVDRLLLMAKAHRTATLFRAPGVVRMMTNLIGHELPDFDKFGNQLGGVRLTDLAKLCRWTFTQPEIPGYKWELKPYLAEYLQKDVKWFLVSKEMCSMLKDCIMSETGQ